MKTLAKTFLSVIVASISVTAGSYNIAQAVELVRNTGYQTGLQRGDIGRYDFAVSIFTGAQYSLAKTLEITLHKGDGSQDCDPNADDDRSEYRLEVYNDNGSDAPGTTLLGTFAAPSTINNGSGTVFTNEEGVELDTQSKYWVVLNVIEDIPNNEECHIRRTQDSRQVGRSGWTIGNFARRRDWNASSWTNDDRARKMVIKLNGSEWPTTPTNLRVHSKTHNEITLTWDRPSTVGDPALSEYFVETRRNVDWVNREWVDVGQSGNVTAFSHTGLSPHTLYTYRVKAGYTDQSVRGSSSNEITVRTERVPPGYEGSAVWSATLNVKDLTGGFYGCSGVDAAKACSKTSVLSENEMIVGSTNIQVDAIAVNAGVLSMVVRPLVYKNLFEDLYIHTGDRSVSFSNANFSREITDTTIHWENTGIVWNDGETIQLRIVGRPEPPEFIPTNSGRYQCFMEENPEPGSAVCNSYHPRSGEFASVWAYSATDPNGNRLTYSLEGRDASKFNIDPVNGNVTTKTGVTYDYETQESCRFEGRTLRRCLELILKATDPGGLSGTQEAIVSLDPGFEITEVTTALSANITETPATFGISVGRRR